MKNLKINFVLLLCTILLASCSLEKRVYNKGYHVSKQQSVKAENVNIPKENNRKSASINTSEKKQEEFTAAAETEYTASASNNKSVINKWLKSILNECDVIFFKDGTEVKAKVIEISDKAIQYKKCDSENQIVFSTSSDNVLMVIYSNGEKYIPKNESNERQPVEAKTTTNSAPQNNSPKIHPLGIVSISAAFLAALLGIVGFVILLATPYLGGGFAIALAVLLAIAAIVTGIIGLVRTRRKKYAGAALSIVGLSVGAAVLLIIIFMLFLLALAVFAAYVSNGTGGTN